MGAPRIPEATKAKALEAVASGGQVRMVAKRFGVRPQNIYQWLRSSGNGGGSTLVKAIPAETKSPLEQENEMLWKLVRKQVREGKLSLH